MCDLTEKQPIDRLLVIVSGSGILQVLKVTQLFSKSEENQSQAVIDT